MICWVRIAQWVGYELIESGYETSELGYESSGYERSMGTKRLDTLLKTENHKPAVMLWVPVGDAIPIFS